MMDVNFKELTSIFDTETIPTNFNENIEIDNYSIYFKNINLTNNCKIEESKFSRIVFENCTFNDLNLIDLGCKILVFSKCTIHSEIYVQVSERNKIIEILSCKFKENIKFTNDNNYKIEQLKIKESDFKNGLKFNNIISSEIILENISSLNKTNLDFIELGKKLCRTYDEELNYFNLSQGLQPDLIFENTICHFTVIKCDLFLIKFLSGNFDYISIAKNPFRVLFLGGKYLNIHLSEINNLDIFDISNKKFQYKGINENILDVENLSIFINGNNKIKSFSLRGVKFQSLNLNESFAGSLGINIDSLLVYESSGNINIFGNFYNEGNNESIVTINNLKLEKIFLKQDQSINIYNLTTSFIKLKELYVKGNLIFDHIIFNNNNRRLDILNCVFENIVLKNTDLTEKNLNVSCTLLSNTFKNATLNSFYFPESIKIPSLTNLESSINFEIDNYRTLKKMYIQNDDILYSEKYKTQEYKLLETIHAVDSSDKFILKFNFLTNLHGTNWLLPLFWIIVFNLTFYTLALASLHDFLFFKDYPHFLEHYFQIINFFLITHRLEDVFSCEYFDSNKMVILIDSFMRIINGILIYQFIAAFRRFGKRTA